MIEFLIFNQQMPGQVPQQPQPMPPAQPAQPMPAQPQPAAQPVPGVQQPAAQPMPGAAPSGPVSMQVLAQWAGIGGAASGALQAVLSIINGFDIMGMGIYVVIGAVLGILAGIIIGQFGSKIPIEGTVMVKGALFMFLLNAIVGFLFLFAAGTTGTMVGIVGVAGGAFLYGFILEKKIPNLM